MYRKIVTDFWDDRVVEELSSAATYVLLYLLTSPKGTISGCYEVSRRRISKDTKLSMEEVVDAVDELCGSGLISYSDETNEVLINSWAKYNWTKSQTVKKPVADGILKLKNVQLKAVMAEKFKDYYGEPIEYDIDTVQIQYQYDTDTSLLSVNRLTSSKDNGKESTSNNSQVVKGKHKHGKFDNVLLTDEELVKLKEQFPSEWQRRIDDLSYYIGSTGKSYKSHYRTILSWARKDGKTQAKKSREEELNDRFAKFY